MPGSTVRNWQKKGLCIPDKTQVTGSCSDGQDDKYQGGYADDDYQGGDSDIKDDEEDKGRDEDIGLKDKTVVEEAGA